MDRTQARHIAEAVRTACVDAARTAYHDAGLSGLCDEGRFERALDEIAHFDLEPVLTALEKGHAP